MKRKILTVTAVMLIQNTGLATEMPGLNGEPDIYGTYIDDPDESDSSDMYMTPPPQMITPGTLGGDDQISSHPVPNHPVTILRIDKPNQQLSVQHHLNSVPDIDPHISNLDVDQPHGIKGKKKKKKPVPPPPPRKKGVNYLASGNKKVAPCPVASVVKTFQCLSDSHYVPFPGGVIFINGVRYHTDFISSWIKERHKSDPVANKPISQQEKSRILFNSHVYGISYENVITVDWVNSMKSKMMRQVESDIRSGSVSNNLINDLIQKGLTLEEFVYYYCSIDDLWPLLANSLTDSFSRTLLISQKKSGIIVKKPDFKNDSVTRSYYLIQYFSKSNKSISTYLISNKRDRGIYLHPDDVATKNGVERKFLPSFLALFNSDPKTAYRYFVSRVILPQKPDDHKEKHVSCLSIFGDKKKKKSSI